MNRHIVAALIILVLCGAAMPAPGLVSTALAQGEPPSQNLFADAPAPPGYLPPDDNSIIRSRFVTVDFGQLSAQTPLVTLNLFADTSYGASLESATIPDPQNPNRFVWQGSLEDAPGGRVTLAVNEQTLAGTVSLPGMLYRIKDTGLGARIVEQVQNNDPMPESQPIPVVPPELGEPTSKPLVDDGSIIDVLVVYTPASRARYGQAGIESLIDLAVTEANQAYTNSQISTQLRLVYKGEVNYVESTGMNIDLGRLQGQADGFMDEVHGLRDFYKADLVSLIEENAANCGIAYQMSTLSPTFENHAFSVVASTCATGYYSFVHELAHTMGSQHDHDNALVPPVSPYAYGYKAPDNSFRTIMAYPCAVSCQRVQHFSNPHVQVNGQPTGIDYDADPVHAADNARSINEVKETVANFRNSTALPGLGQARRFAVFHGIEAGHHPQTWAFNKSFLWGDIGIGPGVRTDFKSDSTVIGDCYEQPGQAAGKGCADIEPGGGAPAHVPPTYLDITVDLTPVVQDIRRVVSTVDALPATQRLERITGGTTVASPACGMLNVIRVAREVNIGGANQGMTIQGCPTDTFIFDVDGQWASSGGRVRLSGGVPASNVLWVFKGRLQNSGDGGWAGTAIFDTADGADNKGKDLNCADCALLVLNGKLSIEGKSNLRWHPFTVHDYGDAPESYGTLYDATDGAARHKYTPNGPRLGTAWDAEANGQPTSGDGSDEDGVSEESLVIQVGGRTRVRLEVNATNPNGANATLACWIDFNRNGNFLDAGERAAATVRSSTNPALVTVTFSGFGSPAAGESYLRCRISTNEAAMASPATPIPPAAPPPGSGTPMFPFAKSSYLLNDGWPDGEVEDYPVSIDLSDPGQDYGDAPDTGQGTGTGNYNTLRADGGPRHMIVEDLSLGATLPDLELYGLLQNETATADDGTGIDDEDAIPTLPVITAGSTSVRLAVVATNTNVDTDASMQCWIDFNRNGVFNDPGEASGPATVSANTGTATYNLSFTPASASTPGASYIRCRIAFEAIQVSDPQNPAFSGEVEDHLVQISS